MNKKWYKSKTIWAALLMGVLSVVKALGYPIPKEVYGVLTGLGLYGLRVAK